LPHGLDYFTQMLVQRTTHLVTQMAAQIQRRIHANRANVLLDGPPVVLQAPPFCGRDGLDHQGEKIEQHAALRGWSLAHLLRRRA
jgi:hypothetical protein